MTMRARSVGAAIVLTALGGGTAVAQQGFTLEQVMSAPFPSDLVVAAHVARFAWEQDDRGMRNIWVAAGPASQGRQITHYVQDDGQELASLQFTPNGTSIVYVRGGAPNRAGEIPNPTSNAQGEEQAVWVVPVAGGAPRELGQGSAPAVSPKGDVVAFLRHGDVWSASLEDSTRASQLFKARGSQRSLTWSPDGSRLAYVSNRGDHAFIGVYDLASKQVRYLDPSVDHDGDPVWSPDGQRIVFLRIPGDKQAWPFLPRREGLPWSIRVADVTTSTGHEVWRADPGVGSVFRGIVAPHELFWAAGDRIVFPWEKTGWVHLYAVPLAGGAAAELTPGEFEVEHVTMTPDSKAMIYSSNQGDIDRRHLWRVAVAAGAPVSVTQGNGIEWSPVVAEDGAIALMASDARTPAHAALLAANGTLRPLAPQTLPADFPSKQLVEPQQVIFSAADGLRIHGQLFLPHDLKPGERRPAVIFFHGGSQRQMLLGWHYMYYYSNAYAENQYLASRGYVVLSVNYRSGIGYGMAFREAIHYGADGASEYNDVVGAGLYLRSRADVDPDRIGLWGGSYGGYLTALGLARSSDLFKAGVDFHGVHDWNVVIKNFAPTYDSTRVGAVARVAFRSSPMAAIDTWRSPVLLIQGDDDRNVPFSESVDLAEALRARGVHVEQLVFPDEVHDFLLYRDWLRAYKATAAFLDRELNGAAAP